MFFFLTVIKFVFVESQWHVWPHEAACEIMRLASVENGTQKGDGSAKSQSQAAAHFL